MDEYKRKLLEVRINGRVPITNVDGQAMLSQLQRLLELPANTSWHDVGFALYDIGDWADDGPNADDINFNTVDILRGHHLAIPERVFIYWPGIPPTFCEADLQFVSDYLSDIWYPGPDEIDMYHPDLLWVMSIDEDGLVKIVNLQDPGA